MGAGTGAGLGAGGVGVPEPELGCGTGDGVFGVEAPAALSFVNAGASSSALFFVTGAGALMFALSLSFLRVVASALAGLG